MTQRPSPLDWEPCLQALQGLLDELTLTQTAAQHAMASGQADAFALQCGQLARTLATSQHLLQRSLAQGTPTPAVIEKLQAIKVGLDALREGTTRMEASAARALQVLFPSDSVQTYSRLGAQAYGSATRPRSTYLKA